MNAMGQAMRRLALCGALFALGLEACEDAPTVGAGAEKFDVELVSFEALYEMSLSSSRPSANIAGYDGLMSFSWSDTCDGWASSVRTVAQVSTKDGGDFISVFSSTSWEAADQTRFRFNSTTKIDGEITRQVAADATRPGLFSEGTVAFEEPEKRTVPLPAGVLFPGRHTLVAIDSAKRHERLLTAPIFDGSTEHIPYETITVIGAARQGPPAGDEALQSLAGLTRWPMQIGYHVPESEEGLPDYEMKMDVYENGVPADLIMDYGDHALSGKLVKLIVEPAGC